MSKLLKLRFISLCFLSGTAGFLLLGHLIKLVPAFYWGIVLLLSLLNLTALYLMFCYDDLKEYSWYFFFAEALAGALLWLA